VSKGRLLGSFRELLVGLKDAVVFALLRAAGMSVAWRSVREESTDSGMSVDKNKKYLASEAAMLFEIGKGASDHTDDKAKHLMALSASLFTFLLVFARDLEPHILMVLSVVAFLLTVVLCQKILGVRVEMAPSPVAGESFRDEWARDLISSYIYNRNRHAFRVEVFRAACRWFLLGFVLAIPMLFLGQDPRVDPIAEELHGVRKALEGLSNLGWPWIE
jgi:hypothetical protein